MRLPANQGILSYQIKRTIQNCKRSTPFMTISQTMSMEYQTWYKGKEKTKLRKITDHKRRLFKSDFNASYCIHLSVPPL